MIFAYSTDEEVYEELGDFGSHQEAFAALVADRPDELDEGAAVWIGIQATVPVEGLVSSFIAEDVVERCSELAYEKCGEIAEDWPDLKNGDMENLERKLHGVVVEFLKEHSPPRFWTVDCVKRFQIPVANPK